MVDAGIGAILFLFRGLGRNQFFVGNELVELGLGLWWVGFLLGYLKQGGDHLVELPTRDGNVVGWSV